MAELIAFARGMSSFADNRGTQDSQEQLIRGHVSKEYRLKGIHGVTGNYAFVGPDEAHFLRSDLLALLKRSYKVREVAVVERSALAGALKEFTEACRRRHPRDFQRSQFAVGESWTRWRLGMVFVQGLCDQRLSHLDGLFDTLDSSIEVLSMHIGLIGLLKFDPPQPRIPWGVPGKIVEELLQRQGASWLATARSAQTIRGVLGLFEG